MKAVRLLSSVISFHFNDNIYNDLVACTDTLILRLVLLLNEELEYLNNVMVSQTETKYLMIRESLHLLNRVSTSVPDLPNHVLPEKHTFLSVLNRLEQIQDREIAELSIHLKQHHHNLEQEQDENYLQQTFQ